MEIQLMISPTMMYVQESTNPQKEKEKLIKCIPNMNSGFSPKSKETQVFNIIFQN